jgi:hypothetical protein
MEEMNLNNVKTIEFTAPDIQPDDLTLEKDKAAYAQHYPPFNVFNGLQLVANIWLLDPRPYCDQDPCESPQDTTLRDALGWIVLLFNDTLQKIQTRQIEVVYPLSFSERRDFPILGLVDREYNVTGWNAVSPTVSQDLATTNVLQKLVWNGHGCKIKDVWFDWDRFPDGEEPFA